MPIDLQDMVSRLNSESYSGEERDGYSDGQGVYRFSNGIVYTGNLYEGMFDGDGTLAFAQGGKFIAKWDKGKLVHGTYYYDDELQYFSKDWSYATDADRRFWTGIQNGIILADEPQLTDKNPPMWIPVGTHDVGNGYFDPLDGMLYKYNGQTDRKPTEAEAAWAVRKCRIGVAEVEEEEEVGELQFSEEDEEYDDSDYDEGDEGDEGDDEYESDEEEQDVPLASDRTQVKNMVNNVMEETLGEPYTTRSTKDRRDVIENFVDDVLFETTGVKFSRVSSPALTSGPESLEAKASELVDGVLEEVLRPNTAVVVGAFVDSVLEEVVAGASVDSVLEEVVAGALVDSVLEEVVVGALVDSAVDQALESSMSATRALVEGFVEEVFDEVTAS